MRPETAKKPFRAVQAGIFVQILHETFCGMLFENSNFYIDCLNSCVKTADILFLEIVRGIKRIKNGYSYIKDRNQEAVVNE